MDKHIYHPLSSDFKGNELQLMLHELKHLQFQLGERNEAAAKAVEIAIFILENDAGSDSCRRL